MKVLLVEENGSIRNLIRRVLMSSGTWIHECADSTQAIAAYAAGRPDFVIMDTGTKDLNGIEVSRQIKAMDPEARIILVSDYDDAAMRESARLAGACGYVLKDNLLGIAHLLKISKGDEQ
jgi:DNA-binding NarL/FixJ family response regulator